MISSLRGRVLHLDAESVIVDVGGVGFTVAVTPLVARAFHVGDEIVLHTNLIVREDALSLFGFESREELTVFVQMLSVSGVGPKSALGVLAALSVDQIADAVNAEDDAPFRRVTGIGPKTAKLIVVQLAGKLHSTGTCLFPHRRQCAGIAGVAGRCRVGRARLERARCRRHRLGPRGRGRCDERAESPQTGARATGAGAQGAERWLTG